MSAATTAGTPEGVQPKGAASSHRLSSAALELGAHPARYGFHPMDALTATRLFYAA